MNLYLFTYISSYEIIICSLVFFILLLRLSFLFFLFFFFFLFTIEIGFGNITILRAQIVFPP